MKTTLKITMPESWADISLSKYLALQYDLEAYKDDREAQMNFMISHLCGIQINDILSFDIYLIAFNKFFFLVNFL